MAEAVCLLCGEVDAKELLASGRLCRSCLNREHIAHSVARLEVERGELTVLESEIAKHASSHLAIARNTDAAFERSKTFGDRVADRVAGVGGSWRFVIGFFVVLVGWIAINVGMARGAFDPYPFILLNLVLSTLAAVQAPIIMMSQNRVSARDRSQADEDYRTNLKAELEIASLHEKIDHLLHSQWEQLIEMQTTQLDLLEQLAEKHGYLRT
ncbi:MAG: DUF1003 domain-containing protein [Proteobacteria bacterium]|nr:DUF1003 domain-containing protein [Pseudomonadota bacterium]